MVLPDGRNLNHEVVKAGMAWWYRRYAPDDSTLQRLKQEARQAKRGLWQDAKPVPPWEWRRERRGAEGFSASSPSHSHIPNPVNGPY